MQNVLDILSLTQGQTKSSHLQQWKVTKVQLLEFIVVVVTLVTL